MTFVSIDIDSGKAVILNPFKFEKMSLKSLYIKKC